MRALPVELPGIDELAAEFLDEQRRGEEPSIEEYARRYPQMAGEIREVFPTIARLEGLKREIYATAPRFAAGGLAGISRLGDFRIVRELGRGGMGVVYEAEQMSLRRRVALKVLGANLAAAPKLTARFRREAEAAAQLHHTNIVPVFGVGEEHGICFYAMQYIDGAPLNRVIHALRRSEKLPRLADLVNYCNPPQRGKGVAQRETRMTQGSTPIAEGGPRPKRRSTSKDQPATAHPDRDPQKPARVLPFEASARMVADIADALQFAHEHGVLHRDVKPSNIIVDREGAVWITDFGLAKHEDAGELTRSGDIVGTLRYMAPEQFDGQTDARSDIYSLGLTLCELMTGRPAFVDSLRGALLQKKTQPFPRLRTLNRKIPRDLETIVQKACAPLAADRYQTAGEMASDLRSFLADRPIAARRLPVTARMWRWSRRNPVVAGLSALAVLLMVAVTFAIMVGNQRTNLALQESLDQQSRAEANLNSAIAALQEIADDLASRGVPHTLQTLENHQSVLQTTPVTAADAEMLEKLLTFFDKFAAANQTDLTAETAKIHLTVGDIRHRLGELENAERDYMRAVDTYIALAHEEPENPDSWIDVADAWNRVGMVQAERGRVFSAMRSHDYARGAIEASPPAMAADRGKFTLARTLTIYHEVFARAGASDLFGRSEPGSGWSLPPVPKEPRARRGRDGGGWNRRRDVPARSPRDGDRDRNDKNEQRESYAKSMERALWLLEELVDREPGRAVYRLSLAQAYRVQMVMETFDPPDERRVSPAELGERSICILEDLHFEYPDDPQYRYELARVLCSSVRWDESMAIDEASCRIEYAAMLCHDLISAYPQVPSYLSLAAVVARHEGRLSNQCRDYADAERQYLKAEAIYGDLTARFPGVSLYPIARAQTHMEFAGGLLQAGDPRKAHEECSKAVVIAEECLPLRDNDLFFQRFLRRLTNRRNWLSYAVRDNDRSERTRQF